MAYLNKVFLIGNLVQDPEMRYTPNGTAVCSIRLAVNRRYQTKQGEDREETCFVEVVTFARQAELCESYLQKGAPAYVEGRLQLDQWEDKNTGAKRSRLKVNAQNVQFLGAPGRRGSFAGDDNDEQSSKPGDNSSDYQQNESQKADQPEASGANEDAEGDVNDKIPF
ncbi:MAG: single-stranded DNA-binding protein [Verrucomicrobiota bacterium]